MKRYKVKRRDYPEICPKCGHREIEHWGKDFGPEGFLDDPVSCNKCDFTWVVRFKYQKWMPTGKYEEVRGLHRKVSKKSIIMQR